MTSPAGSRDLNSFARGDGYQRALAGLRSLFSPAAGSRATLRASDTIGRVCFALHNGCSDPVQQQRKSGAGHFKSSQSASHCHATKDPVQPVAVLTISGTLSLTTGTAQCLKHQLQQETRCSQPQGKEVHRLKSLCHLTGKPKSSPQAHLCLQSIPAGRRAGHSCHLSTPCCCKAA